MRPALRQGLCMFSLCLLLPRPCKAGRAIFGGRESLGATCLAPGLMHVSLVFATHWPVQSRSRSFLGRWSMSATCLASGLIACFLVFSTPRPVQSGSRSFSLLGATCLAQGGSRSFFWEEVASATCLALGGSHFFSGWPDYLPFWIPFGVAGLKFRGKRP